LSLVAVGSCLVVDLVRPFFHWWSSPGRGPRANPFFIHGSCEARPARRRRGESTQPSSSSPSRTCLPPPPRAASPFLLFVFLLARGGGRVSASLFPSSRSSSSSVPASSWMSRSGSCCRAGRSRTDGDGISEGAAGTTAGVRPHLGKARLCRPPPLHLSAQRGAGRTVALPLHPPDRAAGEGCGDGAREVGQFTSVLGGWMSLTAKRFVWVRICRSGRSIWPCFAFNNIEFVVLQHILI
jgi:hypothetical protein